MNPNNTQSMIARLATLDEKAQQRLLATIKHQALQEIRSALKHPVYC